MRNYDPMRNKDYRREELCKEVLELLDCVRNEKRKEVPKKAIDIAIELQETRSIYTACNYIRYLLLHELNWIDVFGKHAKEYDQLIDHYKQNKEMELKIDDLTQKVDLLTKQNEQMQTMLLNMASILSGNKVNIHNRRSA